MKRGERKVMKIKLKPKKTFSQMGGEILETGYQICFWKQYGTYNTSVNRSGAFLLQLEFEFTEVFLGYT